MQPVPAPAPLPFWIAGRPATSDIVADVVNPYDGSVVGRHAVPTAGQVEEAVAAAWAARHETAAQPAAVRAEALMHVSTSVTQRAEEIARLITAENGKPLMWARAETHRVASTFRWAAEEARRFNGEFQRLDTDPAAAGRAALVRRFPIGPVLGIAPFNFPLNLTSHKVAPAIAVGAPIIIKPAPSTPLSALLLGELLAETGLPEGAWSVLPVGNDVAPGLVADPRLPVVSFTGSDVVGYQIQAAVPAKHVTLELGGNAAAVVLADWSSPADLEWAASRIATFANYQAGQSCISVQRVIVDRSLLDQLVPMIVERVQALRTGSPWDDETVVGPLVNEAAAIRVQSWIDEAVAVRCPGARRRHPRGSDRGPDRPDRRPRRCQGVRRGGLRSGPGDRPGRWRGRGLRHRERLALRPADRRVHAQHDHGVPGAQRARGRRESSSATSPRSGPTRCPTAA